MNTLFLMVDEMAWWALNSAAEGGAHTPNLDALAAQGMVFDSAYTPSPICVPARAAIATGRNLHEIGYWSSAEPYEGKVRSWGHHLRDVGVETASIGKLHYRNAQDDCGFDRQILPMHVEGGEGWLVGLLRQPLPVYEATKGFARDIGTGWTDYTRYDRQVTQAACDWLTDPARKAQPWAAFVSWLSPHYPMIAPEEFFALYDPGDYSGAPEPLPDHPVLQEMARFWAYDPEFTREGRQIAQAAYRALCSFVDAEIGKVLAALDRAGLAEDTLIIFASDHGDMMGEKGFWAKSVMYEGSVRVPMILAGPGVQPGRRSDPVSLIDAAATICEVAGADQAGLSGRSLLAPPDPGRQVISEYHDGGSPVGITMLRWNGSDGTGWKYVYYAEGHPPQLFNLTDDPNEERDLSKSHPDRLKEAQTRLARHLDPEEVNARALADQARKIAKFGGREAILARPQWNYTRVGAS